VPLAAQAVDFVSEIHHIARKVHCCVPRFFGCDFGCDPSASAGKVFRVRFAAANLSRR
jgi:hypothetical protein